VSQLALTEVDKAIFVLVSLLCQLVDYLAKVRETLIDFTELFEPFASRVASVIHTFTSSQIDNVETRSPHCFLAFFIDSSGIDVGCED
jgi:hypothetical protein